MLSIAHFAESEGGTMVLFSGALVQTMFAGVLSENHDTFMTDTFGLSRIFRVRITPTTVEFTKKYERRNDEIVYRFKRRNRICRGSYEGEAVGCGKARCVITPMPRDFFLKPSDSSF